MLRSYVVRLSPSVKAVFPSECVACGEAAPESSIGASDRAFTVWSLFSPLFALGGRKDSVKAPACAACRRADTWQKWMRLGMLCAILFGAISFVAPWVKTFDLSRRASRWLTVLIVIVCLIPVYLWSKFFPRPFVIEVEKGATEYHFARPDYAEAFAQANDAIVED